MTPTLLINADDFGLTFGVNRAISELHNAGVLTSTTLMATGRAFQNAVERSRTLPNLAVGCHLVFTGATPISDPSNVPSLLEPDGRFPPTLLRLLKRVYRGQVVEAEIEREATAQIRRLQTAGVSVSHVDSHKHTHLFPRIARPLMRAAAICGVRAIRNPFEVTWSAKLSRGSSVRAMERLIVPNIRRQFDKLCREFGLVTNEGCIGVSSTTRLDDESLTVVLRNASSGSLELICHPGYHDADLAATGTRLREAREVERATLLRRIPPEFAAGRLRLTNFRELIYS